MSDFVEKISLDLDGTAVDGQAKKGLEATESGVGKLIESMKKLADDTSAVASIGAMATGITALAGAAIATGAAVGEAMGRIIGETARAAADVDKYTRQIASAYGSTNDWASSMERASRVIPGLEKSAVLTGASVGDLAKSFRSLSLLTNGANADVMRVTDSLTVMAKTAGVSTDELVATLQRASLTGQLPLRGGAGREIGLQFFPGLSGPEAGAQIKAAQEAGTLLDLLTSKMGDQSEKARALADSWEVLGGSWEKISHSLKAEIGVAWDPLRFVFAELRDVGLSGEFREIAKSIGQIGKEIVASEVGPWVARWIVFREAVVMPLLDQLGPLAFLLEKLGLIKPLPPTDVSEFLASSHKMIPGVDTMTQLDLAGIQKGRLEFEKLFETLDREHALAGLTGIDKTLAEISVKLAKETKDINATGGAYVDAAERAKLLGVAQDTAAKNRGVALAAEAARQEALTLKAQADAERWSAATVARYQKIDDLEASLAANLAKIRKGTSTDAALAIQEEVDAHVEATNRLAELAVKEATQQAALNGGRLKDGTDLASKLTEIEKARIEKDTALQAAGALKEKTLLDHRAGDWQAYYNDLMEQASIAGTGIVEAMQESLRQVADAAYKSAVTIGDGVNAALLKIRSELKTEGQIWADYFAGVWGGITAGLDTMLVSLEHGTGSLKDVFRSMTDSVLKSFNTMVEEMVKKFLLGTKEMGGGGLSSLFGGTTPKTTLDAQGNVKLPTGWSASQVEGGQVQGGPTKTASPYAPTTATSLGAAGFAALASIGTMSQSDTFASGMTPYATASMLAIEIGGWVGAIVAGVISTVGAIINLITPRNDELVAKYSGAAMARAIKIGEAVGAAGSDSEQATSAALKISNSLTSYFSDMFKDVDPGVRSDILADLNKKLRDYLLSIGDVGLHAGGGADFQADIAKLFNEIIPKQVMHAMFGQRTLSLADPGGMTGAGLAGGIMGAWGTLSQFTKVDPNSPLVSFLTGIGFTIAKVNAIAGQIDVRSEEEFQKYFSGLVGIVLTEQKLHGLVGKSYAETVAGADADAARSPAAKMAEGLANVVGLLRDVSLYSGDTQVTKAKEALAAAQQFYDAAKAAMVQLAAMAKQITQDYLDSVKKIQDALKSPAELLAQSTANLEADYQRMRFAANPEDLAAAWASARTDFEAVAGELVARIQQIKSLLADIHTLQAAIANGPGADAQTNPFGWLAQNTIDMGKYEAAMKSATPGSPEEIAAATTFAGLIRDRYQMELALLERVRSTIASIDASFANSIEQLQLQSIGSVKNGVWTPDVHGQGEFAMAQITRLRGEIAGATSPEQLASINSEIQKWLGILASQPQDPAHYLESRNFLINLSHEIQDQFDAAGAVMTTTIEDDISTLGVQLGEAETRMSGALDQVNQDLVDLMWHFKRASEFATEKLNLWGVEIAGQLNTLGPILATMVTNFTDVNTALTGAGSVPGGGGGKPGFIPVLEDATVAIGDFAGRLRGGSGGPGGNAGAAPVNVTANVTVNQGGVVDVDVVLERLRPTLTAAFKTNNVQMARAFRDNPSLIRNAS